MYYKIIKELQSESDKHNRQLKDALFYMEKYQKKYEICFIDGIVFMA